MSETNESHPAMQIEKPAATESHKSEGVLSIDDLPNELLLNIFGYLDGPQPSAAASALHDEPTFDITYSDVADLKTISCISKRWREAVIPVLFRHSRLTIPKTRSKEPSRSRADIQHFFDFVTRNQLSKSVASFTLICHDHNFENDYKRDPQNVMSIFWESLFAVIDPLDLLIVAPPEALSFFTDCTVNDEESWNFDSPCHYLRLEGPQVGISRDVIVEKVTSKSAEVIPKSSRSPLAADTVPTPPTRDAGNASSNRADTSRTDAEGVSGHGNYLVLFSRPWTKLLLNEGSFIKAYSTYEYWNRTPPSILATLLGTPTSSALISETVRNMEYVGIFPTESHFSTITRQCPRLDRLYIQLVPRNGILDDETKMKQVQSEDLWMERNRCYALLMRELFNNPPEGNFNFLKIFESGDSADKDAWNMAVEYVKRANNGWKVAEEGVFVRELPEDGAEGSALSVDSM